MLHLRTCARRAERPVPPAIYRLGRGLSSPARSRSVEHPSLPTLSQVGGLVSETSTCQTHPPLASSGHTAVP